MSIANSDQTIQAWDKSSKNYLGGKPAKNSFTALFAKDALHLTIGRNDITDPNIKILDVACGTGALTLNALDKIKNSSNSSILATDFSSKMLKVLRNTIDRENINNIEIREMDGQNMSGVEDNTFDYAYSAFGLIFFPDRIKGLKEMNRVLKPNGKVAITAWRTDTPFCMMLNKGFDHFGITETPNNKTLLSLSDTNKFKKEMEEAGFKDVVIHTVTHDIVIPCVKEFVASFTDNPIYECFFDYISRDKKDELDNVLVQFVSEQWPKLRISSPCNIGVGTK